MDDKCFECPQRGRCCNFEAVVGGVRVNTDEQCEFMDAVTGLCTIYEDRHSREDRTGLPCFTIDEMLDLHTVPVECVHVIDKEKYRQETDRRRYHFKVIVED